MRHHRTHLVLDVVLFLVLVLGLLVVAANPAGGQTLEEARELENRGFYQSYVYGQPDKPSLSWLTAYGGRLYDRWWAGLRRESPTGTHPSYPAEGRFTGADSWRCVECHGWDYRGRAGAYGVGIHYTGIAGIEGSYGETPAKIVARLRDDTHGFTPAMIPDDAALALALFVTQGQVGSAMGADPDTGRFDGDAVHGQAIFQSVCAICHGYDGGAWIGGEDGTGDSLGAISRSNPARVLHKVMNGQTYADMPAMRVFGLATVIDILTYVQTLEEED